ncbi:MAG: hemerythrin domain-containing protein [Candidatus Sulfotelmatobacter sp.]|jgi:iron-sulfur cluster repair protein YtfE (RIC family)
MLRDKSLIPLSHQHQRALALCVRIDRAQPIPAKDLQAWQVEIEQLFEQEIEIHFAAEESVIFPAAERFSELVTLVKELIAEHGSVRDLFRQAEARCMSAQTLSALGQQLSAHIRKEERQLFECIQRLMNPQELAALGMQLESALKDSTQSCVLQNEVTKLKPAR